MDLVQKTFRECTIDDDESHSQGSRASLTCDLLLAAFSKQIHSKTRIHTRGQSPGFLQGLSPENSLVSRLGASRGHGPKPRTEPMGLYCGNR